MSTWQVLFHLPLKTDVWAGVYYLTALLQSHAKDFKANQIESRVMVTLGVTSPQDVTIHFTKHTSPRVSKNGKVPIQDLLKMTCVNRVCALQKRTPMGGGY